MLLDIQNLILAETQCRVIVFACRMLDEQQGRRNPDSGEW
jgi:hypothetical protein